MPCPQCLKTLPTAFIPSEEILFPSVLDSFSLGPSSRLWEEVKNAWNAHPPWPAPQPPAELSQQPVPLRNCWTLGLDRGRDRGQSSGKQLVAFGSKQALSPPPLLTYPGIHPLIAQFWLASVSQLYTPPALPVWGIAR